MRSTEDILDVMTEHEEKYDIDDMLVEDDIPEDEPQPCRCEFDDHARKGFVSYQVDDEGG